MCHVILSMINLYDQLLYHNKPRNCTFRSYAMANRSLCHGATSTAMDGYSTSLTTECMLKIMPGMAHIIIL